MTCWCCPVVASRRAHRVLVLDDFDQELARDRLHAGRGPPDERLATPRMLHESGGSRRNRFRSIDLAAQVFDRLDSRGGEDSIREKVNVSLNPLAPVAQSQVIGDGTVSMERIDRTLKAAETQLEGPRFGLRQQVPKHPIVGLAEIDEHVKAARFGQHLQRIGREVMDMREVEHFSRRRVRRAQVGAFHIEPSAWLQEVPEALQSAAW